MSRKSRNYNLILTWHHWMCGIILKERTPPQQLCDTFSNANWLWVVANLVLSTAPLLTLDNIIKFSLLVILVCLHWRSWNFFLTSCVFVIDVNFRCCPSIHRFWVHYAYQIIFMFTMENLCLVVSLVSCSFTFVPIFYFIFIFLLNLASD